MSDNLVEIPFNQVISTLLDENTVFTAHYLHRLSDLEGEDLAELAEHWPQVSAPRRRAVMADLEALHEVNFLLSYEALSRLALSDQDGEVRLTALRTLWDYDPRDLIPHFIEMCKMDPEAAVRAGAATALGKFIYLGELEELSAKSLAVVEGQLLETIRGSDEPLVRRRALESLGFSSRAEVPALIEEASARSDEGWLASALFAMGRSVDDRWLQFVMDHLEHVSPKIQLEAARAAGELEIGEAVPRLLELIEEGDEDVRSAAIWSLSQIGGKRVRNALQALFDLAFDSEDAEYIENALDNLTFNQDLIDFSLFDFDEDTLDSLIVNEDDMDIDL
jgi:HEAT repeat protein